MSTSSNNVKQQVDSAIRRAITFPEWVDSFLEMPFFEKCGTHDVQKNELNRYCITCKTSACRCCITSGAHDHEGHHSILTIYRHVYQNVVPLSEMENHLDCRIIQPYKCNKKWVVSLTPLPHNGSGSLIEGRGACHFCKRKLTDPDRFHYCSIACKVQSNSRRGYSALIIMASEKKEEDESTDKDKSCKRRRKGVPHRAPLF